ncbi:flagellar hook protein FlgE [Methylovirgula ligni]|uniref:Flagellar hook protein FlgE n=1 Tax=Methylovirgula ligni TaxID=569860 RepID=A0A3D9YU30_9HYPH|nr:flagellar hook protein FlgE [Methylovirgula ligni]QAY96201.1 flagellar hook protein FlgE [Methylovirgula ligni]REF86096.1 flagellar hook protein FlgE [Methylovirgula ligni]
MSLYSALMASVSGMSAQANALSTISDNIANADTTGYKQASTQFEDMLNEFSTSEYDAGGVGTVVNYNIAQQGDPTSTTTSTNMAIEGNGFFVVENASGETYLTRAGSFAPDANGNLVNASGYTLMGYPISSGSSQPVSYSLDQLQPVQVPISGLSPPVASTSATLTGNLDSGASVDSGTLPAANSASSTYTSMTPVTAYDDLGNSVTLNVYATKTGANTWEVDVYNAADAASGGGFPYSAGPLATQALTFDPTSGALSSTPTSLSVAVPGGSSLSLDVSGLTQVSSSTSVQSTVNGNPPGTFESVSVSASGVLSENYSNGVTTPIYQIPLGTVPSVNSMTSLAGDVFAPNSNSGAITLGAGNSEGFGSINGSELESSTVDLATQLTNMVVTQNAYQANSKAFQVGSDMLSELVNLLK